MSHDEIHRATEQERSDCIEAVRQASKHLPVSKLGEREWCGEPSLGGKKLLFWIGQEQARLKEVMEPGMFHKLGLVPGVSGGCK